jgi:ferredoxin
MPTVTVDGEKSFEVEAGKKLVLAIEDAGIDILHRCGGNARCITCRVEVLGGDAPPPTEAERERLARETDLAPNIPLSCQIRVNTDHWVAVVNRMHPTTGIFVERIGHARAAGPGVPVPIGTRAPYITE